VYRQLDLHLRRKGKTASEILLRESEKPIFFHRGVKPLFIDRLTYYNDKRFEGMYDKYEAA